MAKDRPIQQMTFREKIRDGTHLARELADHVGQAMLPRLAELQSQLSPRPHHHEEDTPDVTLRHLVTAALESERYTAQLGERLEALGQAIVQESSKILNPKE